MVTVEFERGLPTLIVPDSKGKPRRYSLAIEQLDAWIATITRLDSEQSYEVRCHSDNTWTCSCPDMKYRVAERAEDGCKHIKHLHDLKDFAAFVLCGDESLTEILNHARLMFGAQPAS